MFIESTASNLIQDVKKSNGAKIFNCSIYGIGKALESDTSKWWNSSIEKD